MAHIEPLIPELQKVAIQELGEVPSRLSEDLQALKDWLKQQPHLKSCIEDQYLIQFLRGSKYSLETAKEKLDYAFSIPKARLLEDVDEPIFRQFQNKGSILPLPIPLNGCGPRIIIIRMNFHPRNFSEIDFCRYFFAVHSVMGVNDPYACIQGCIYIVDFSEHTIDHLLEFNLNFFRDIGMPLVKNAPCRIKGICVYNLPTYAEYLTKLVISLVNEKLSKRIHFAQKTMDGLKDIVPTKYLPTDYGGENGSLEQLIVEQAKVFEEHRVYLKQVYEYRSDEKLRLGKSPHNFNAEFGVNGSFRKINVD